MEPRLLDFHPVQRRPSKGFFQDRRGGNCEQAFLLLNIWKPQSLKDRPKKDKHESELVEFQLYGKKFAGKIQMQGLQINKIKF